MISRVMVGVNPDKIDFLISMSVFMQQHNRELSEANEVASREANPDDTDSVEDL